MASFDAQSQKRRRQVVNESNRRPRNPEKIQTTTSFSLWFGRWSQTFGGPSIQTQRTLPLARWPQHETALVRAAVMSETLNWMGRPCPVVTSLVPLSCVSREPAPVRRTRVPRGGGRSLQPWPRQARHAEPDDTGVQRSVRRDSVMACNLLAMASNTFNIIEPEFQLPFFC